MSDKKEIYRYDDEISFRKCSLEEKTGSKFGDCTKFYKKRNRFNIFDYGDKFECRQHGFHFYCAKHNTIELKRKDENNECILECPKCNKKIKIKSFDELLRNCQEKLNIKELAEADFIRLDDWYISEIKKKTDVGSNYWIESDIKTDKDGDTIIILYIGKKDSKEKVQYFIKPEKLQLTSDHKDLDPATIISKIEVTLKDRTITQKYDDKVETLKTKGSEESD